MTSPPRTARRATPSPRTKTMGDEDLVAEDDDENTYEDEKRNDEHLDENGSDDDDADDDAAEDAKGRGGDGAGAANFLKRPATRAASARRTKLRTASSANFRPWLRRVPSSRGAGQQAIGQRILEHVARVAHRVPINNGSTASTTCNINISEGNANADGNGDDQERRWEPCNKSGLAGACTPQQHNGEIRLVVRSGG